MSKFLDLEKLEYNDKIVEIDDDIAEAILELNRKGYKTYACCSGHSNIELYQYIAPLEEKEELIKSGHIVFYEDDMVYTAYPSISTHCYVKFDGAYNFENIPNGFRYETKEEAFQVHMKYLDKHPELKGIDKNIVYGDSVSRSIYFLDENDKRKSKEIIEKEIKEANEDLLKWVKELKTIN